MFYFIIFYLYGIGYFIGVGVFGLIVREFFLLYFIVVMGVLGFFNNDGMVGVVSIKFN